LEEIAEGFELLAERAAEEEDGENGGVSDE